MAAITFIMVIVLGISAISALANREYLWSINFFALAFMILETLP
jgi:hypothetical protein